MSAGATCKLVFIDIARPTQINLDSGESPGFRFLALFPKAYTDYSRRWGIPRFPFTCAVPFIIFPPLPCHYDMFVYLDLQVQGSTLTLARWPEASENH